MTTLHHDQYAAICRVIDRVKTDARNLDTDEYASMIVDALTLPPILLTDVASALDRYDTNEAAYEPDGKGYELWEDEKLTVADLLADAVRPLLAPDTGGTGSVQVATLRQLGIEHFPNAYPDYNEHQITGPAIFIPRQYIAQEGS